jgi:glucose/arabinose dehydrogenase
MSRTSFRRTLVAALALACAAPAAASAQQGPPPPPTATSGHPVKTLAQGVPTPIAFAFLGKASFVAAGGAEDGTAKGGIFQIHNGQATAVPGTVQDPVYGLAVRKGALYATSGAKLIRYSKWNGAKFKKSKVLFDGGKNFPGFNGIAFSSKGKLYAGVSFSGDQYDAAQDPAPFAQSVVRFARNKKHKMVLKTFARGIRQPWKLAFVGKDTHPFVTDLAQDSLPEPAPPDQIIHARQGKNYGFPTCTRLPGSPCSQFAKPFRLLPEHSSPMGIDSIGTKLYVALFGGLTGTNPEVVSLSSKKGNEADPKPVLTGYVAPVLALQTHGGRLYTGDLTGAIYSVRP